MEQNHKEQLQLITEMIANTKVRISEGSVFYLLWGWLVVLAAAVNYYLLQFTDTTQHWIVWPILMTLGGVFTAVISARKRKKVRVKTFVDRALSYLWTAFVVSLLLVLIGMVKLGPQKVYPIIIILYGLGTFVSGGILKFKPLMIGAVTSWLIGLYAFFVPFHIQLILISLAIIASYIIPGHLLAKSKAHV